LTGLSVLDSELDDIRLIETENVSPHNFAAKTAIAVSIRLYNPIFHLQELDASQTGRIGVVPNQERGKPRKKAIGKTDRLEVSSLICHPNIQEFE